MKRGIVETKTVTKPVLKADMKPLIFTNEDLMLRYHNDARFKRFVDLIVHHRMEAIKRR